MELKRSITQAYQDPVEIIWIHAALECGIKVERDAEVFAAWDGIRRLRLGTPETLDADDSLAQMILHELCHALVAGKEGREQPDWGLDYDNPADQIYEHAALRLQAALADRFGLRSFFGSTTDFRTYYDHIPDDPFEGDDPACAIARESLNQLNCGEWHGPIQQALMRTKRIQEQVHPLVSEDSIWFTDA